MLRILFQQPLHIWRTLELRYKLEAILLFILIFAFLSTRLDYLFTAWVGGTLSKSELTFLVASGFTFQISITTALIIGWLLPRQKGLRSFLSKPLSKQYLIKLVGFYCFKYLSLYVFLFLPAAVALFSALNFISFISALLIVIIFSLFFLLAFIQLKQKSTSTKIFILKTFLLIFIYYGFFGLFYYYSHYLIHFQIASALIIFGFSLKIYLNNSELDLEHFIPFLEDVYKKPSLKKSVARKIPKFLPATVQPLFEKEFISLWRNPNYKKLKIRSLIIFIIVNAAILFSNIEYPAIWISAITSVLIWVHYSNGFNEKYVFADPDWFIKTVPMRFRHLLSAKYFAEIGYVLALTVGVLIFFQFGSIPLKEQLIWFGVIFLFANTVLFTMLNFQIMFFNDPRLAGYAYHFAMIFIVIMVLNYRLVGPLIGLCLLIFFFYKNVKYFNE